MPRKPSKASRIKKLTSLCEEAVERFQPEYETPVFGGETVLKATYCNVATNYIATNMGYTGFNGRLANAIVQKMRDGEEWAELSPEDAKKAADDGRLVVAGIQADPHGHTAVVMPGRDMVWSKKFHEKVPVVASAGKKNWIIGANWAFKDKPQYWCWVE